jgi:F-type H+-transporting ATPase subunit b
MEGLGISVPTLLTQVITFIILLIVLRFVAYKPLMRMLDERSRRIKESMEQAESIKEQASHTEEDVKKQMELASKEGQEVIARAIRTGEEIKQKARQEAGPEVEALIAKAHLEIQRERDDAADELRKELTDLTILAAGKVIEQELDRETHHQLIDKVLQESTALKKK